MSVGRGESRRPSTRTLARTGSRASAAPTPIRRAPSFDRCRTQIASPASTAASSPPWPRSRWASTSPDVGSTRVTILPSLDAMSSDPSEVPSSAYVRVGTGPTACNAVVAGSLGEAEADTVGVPVPDGDADGVVAVLLGAVLADPEHAASSEIRRTTAERRMVGVMGKRSDDDHTPGGRIGGRRRALLPMLAGLALLASLTPPSRGRSRAAASGSATRSCSRRRTI